MVTRLTQVDVEEKRHRFYQLHMMPDLLGGWSLIREWGRVGSPGTVRMDYFASEAEALEKVAQLRQSKLKRGYRLN